MRWPLVLIHGYPFDQSMWNAVAQELAGKVRVVAPNLPGFGKVPALKSEPSLDRYADFIAELMDRENISAAVVAGMSMGGYVALSFAENYPERLAGLGLVATQAVADSDEARQGRAAMIEKVRREGPAVAAAAIGPKVFAPANVNNPALQSYPKEGAANAGGEGIAWALKAMASRPDRMFVLKNLECPAAVLYGSEDQIVPRERAQQMASAANCDFFEAPGVGHALPLEAPKFVAEKLLALMQRAESFQPHKHTPNRPPVVFAPTDTGRL